MSHRRRRDLVPDDWEMRNMYFVEATPRPERISGILQSRTVIYIDSELWFMR
jgi:hypothetical protein